MREMGYILIQILQKYGGDAKSRLTYAREK